MFRNVCASALIATTLQTTSNHNWSHFQSPPRPQLITLLAGIDDGANHCWSVQEHPSQAPPVWMCAIFAMAMTQLHGVVFCRQMGSDPMQGWLWWWDSCARVMGSQRVALGWIAKFNCGCRTGKLDAFRKGGPIAQKQAKYGKHPL